LLTASRHLYSLTTPLLHTLCSLSRQSRRVLASGGPAPHDPNRSPDVARCIPYGTYPPSFRTILVSVNEVKTRVELLTTAANCRTVSPAPARSATARHCCVPRAAETRTNPQTWP